MLSKLSLISWLWPVKHSLKLLRLIHLQPNLKIFRRVDPHEILVIQLILGSLWGRVHRVGFGLLLLSGLLEELSLQEPAELAVGHGRGSWRLRLPWTHRLIHLEIFLLLLLLLTLRSGLETRCTVELPQL